MALIQIILFFNFPKQYYFFNGHNIAEIFIL